MIERDGFAGDKDLDYVGIYGLINGLRVPLEISPCLRPAARSGAGVALSCDIAPNIAPSRSLAAARSLGLGDGIHF